MSDIRQKLTERLEANFPKGKVKERGAAMVMLAQILIDVTLEVQEAEQRGVTWSIGRIDAMHFQADDSNATDKTFKGIKNALRDEFQATFGIDPAPDYPVKVELTKHE